MCTGVQLPISFNIPLVFDFFQREFYEAPTQEIVDLILKIDHLYGKIQLLGILLFRHGEDFMVGDLKGKCGIKFARKAET